MPRLEALARLVAVGLLPASTACLKVPQESASLSAVDATEVTASELQMRVFEAGRRISYIIEATADTIAFRTSDPNIRSDATGPRGTRSGAGASDASGIRPPTGRLCP